MISTTSPTPGSNRRAALFAEEPSETVHGSQTFFQRQRRPPGLAVEAMVGYGVLQALVLLRLMPWVWSGEFVSGYWAYTFGATSLALAPLLFIEQGGTGAVAALAPILFIFANAVVGVIAIATVLLAVQCRLLPPVVAGRNP